MTLRTSGSRAPRRARSTASFVLLAATLALPSAIGLPRATAASTDAGAAQRRDAAGVPQLVRELESTDPLERERAAATLSDLAEEGVPEAIAALVPLIHDPSSKVRYHVEWGLTRAGAPAVPFLIEAFHSRSDDEGRTRVARLIGRIGLAARAAAPEMRRALRDPQTSAAGQAAYALGRMQAREALPDIVRAYAACRRTSVQAHMARALRDIGSDQATRASKTQLVASVQRDLEQGDPATRAAATRYAADLYRAARVDEDDNFPTKAQLRDLVPGLIAGLEDPQAERALDAARALTLAGRDAAEAAPALARLLGQPQTHHEALRTLRAIGSPEAERIVAERLAFEAIEKRIRSDYAIHDHLGRTQIFPFRVSGTAQQGLRLSARFLYPGREPRRPEYVVIGLESTSAQARFADRRELTWIADGASIAMPGLERALSQSQSGVIEQLAGTLPVRDFLTIARAQRLRARIGSVEFALAPPDLAALRYFAGKIPPQSPAHAGP
jgi:HEAT repeat protein